jgi:hypothetical protein
MVVLSVFVSLNRPSSCFAEKSIWFPYFRASIQKSIVLSISKDQLNLRLAHAEHIELVAAKEKIKATCIIIYIVSYSYYFGAIEKKI